MQPRAYYNDADKYVCAWLDNLQREGAIAAGDVDCRPIQEIKPHELEPYTQCHFFAGVGGWSLALRMAGWPDDEPVWTGSCPCQPWSKMGRRRGEDDPRNLWPIWFELIRRRQPATILGEQVAGAGLWLDNAFADLEGLGYACGAADMPAASEGAPQNRPRLWFVADATGERRRSRLRKVKAQRNRTEFADSGWWPAEPSVSRVAHGIPGAVDFNRAIGNAIAPAVGANFIAAFDEAVSST